MTMALITTVNYGTTRSRTTATDDLNFTQTLHKAAVKWLTKRNVIRATHDHETKEPEPEVAAIENQQPPFAPLSGADKTLADSITAIRSNVTRVLHMYFRNVSAALNDYDTTPAALGGQQDLQHPLTKNITTTATPSKMVGKAATTLATKYLENSTLYAGSSPIRNLTQQSNNVISTTMTHLRDVANVAATTASTATSVTAAATATASSQSIRNITYTSYGIAINSYENCSALFANYTQPQQGLFCNWTWDMFLCWPPTPAGVLAHMSCPAGFHGVDARKFANRKCELNGHWGRRPNDTQNTNGWTDYNPCFKQEVQDLFKKVPNIELVVEIAKRTRTLEIVGLILSLLALILSLIIFCNFRTLRNNRTKIHKNLFIAMVLQVLIRLSLYLDQAFRRDKTETITNTSSLSSIENMPYVCEASYVLLEYAKTAMFMWMFIEGWYLHNMVTVTVFQGRFPYQLYFMVGWGMPVLMTAVWALCTALHYADTMHDCWWNYNLTPYYWILEGPRIVIITINFAFLLNIIRVLVMKLRESQASDIEQTRKAVRAAIVLLPLLGTINVLYLIPALETPWKFALWSYVTHFLTTFQGFFIALIYCFLNGEVRAVLLKSLDVYMSVRGHPEWVPKRASMYSAGYNTAPDTENHNADNKRNESPSVKRLNGRKGSCSTIIHQTHRKTPKIQVTPRLSHSNSSVQVDHNYLTTPEQTAHRHQTLGSVPNNNNNGGSLTSLHSLGGSHNQTVPNRRHYYHQQHLNPQQQQHHHHPYIHHRRPRHSWMLSLCFRGQKNKCVMSNTEMPPKIFMTTKLETFT